MLSNVVNVVEILVIFVFFFVCLRIGYGNGIGHVPDKIEPHGKRLKKGQRYNILAVSPNAGFGQILLLEESHGGKDPNPILAIRVKENASFEAEIGGIYAMIEGELTRLKT